MSDCEATLYASNDGQGNGIFEVVEVETSLGQRDFVCTWSVGLIRGPAGDPVRFMTT
jgi:hypothetical protein